jgi:hypothetical protein
MRIQEKRRFAHLAQRSSSDGKVAGNLVAHEMFSSIVSG